MKEIDHIYYIYDRIGGKKEDLINYLRKYGDKLDKELKLDDMDIKSILYSFPKDSENKLYSKIESDLIVRKKPLSKELLNLMEKDIGKSASKWVIEVAEDYVGCSLIGNSQDFHDCLVDRSLFRAGLKLKIPEEYNFNPNEILQLI